VLIKFVNALRPAALDTEGTGTYPDGLFAAALMRQAQVETSGSLRDSYGRDYVLAQKLKEAPRSHS
jgi:hypothetical protein